MREGRWREEDPEVFRATILQAADQLEVQPLAVEKDYWVCEALRGIQRHHAGQVIFKGGTSLEKLRIIQRFSEDLDLLVVGTYEGKNGPKNAMKGMLNTAAEATGGDLTDVVSGGNPGTFHRRGYLAPPLEHPAAGGIADAQTVLVELGQSGGPSPSMPEQVESLLARELRSNGFDIAEWHDLSTFEVEILHPGRTLLEKLLRVHTFVSRAPNDLDHHGWPRIGRQFYDIYALLADPRVQSLLSDSAQVTDILTSAQAVSHEIGRPDTPPPAGGFAASPAFRDDWEHSTRLRTEHEQAMESLYYGSENPPSFNDVLERVHASAELLDVST